MAMLSSALLECISWGASCPKCQEFVDLGTSGDGDGRWKRPRRAKCPTCVIEFKVISGAR